MSVCQDATEKTATRRRTKKIKTKSPPPDALPLDLSSPISSCPPPPPLLTPSPHGLSLAAHPAPSPDLVTARAVNSRALDALAIAVHQGRISPDKLNGLRQKNAQRTADATACIEIAFHINH